MNLNEFTRIIKFFKDNYTCPNCRQKFNPEMIHILGSADNEGILLVECNKCPANIVVGVTLGGFITAQRRRNGLNNQGRMRENMKENGSYKAISQDDILDIHNFLKYHSGDLSKFLK